MIAPGRRQMRSCCAVSAAFPDELPRTAASVAAIFKIISLPGGAPGSHLMCRRPTNETGAGPNRTGNRWSGA